MQAGGQRSLRETPAQIVEDFCLGQQRFHFAAPTTWTGCLRLRQVVAHCDWPPASDNGIFVLVLVGTLIDSDLGFSFQIGTNLDSASIPLSEEWPQSSWTKSF